jgi:hypothetical protein
MGDLTAILPQQHDTSPKAKTPRGQESIKRTIAATDSQIDALVDEIPCRSDKGDLFVEGGSR